MADIEPPASALSHSARDEHRRPGEADQDPITRALLAAIQARRDNQGDAGVLDALRQTADYCRMRLQETLDQAFAQAEQAQQRFAVAMASDDAAERARLYAEGEVAVNQARSVAAQVEQALLDLFEGVTELTGPALERMQRAVDATQRLTETVQPRT